MSAMTASDAAKAVVRRNTEEVPFLTSGVPASDRPLKGGS